MSILRFRQKVGATLCALGAVTLDEPAPFLRAFADQLDPERLNETGLRTISGDLEWALKTTADEVDWNEEWSGPDDYNAVDACRMETVLRRLVREAGYALPETTRGV